MSRKLLVTLLLSVFVLASLFAGTKTTSGVVFTPSVSTDSNFHSQGTSHPSVPNREQWDLQFVFSPDGVTGEQGNTGCETDGTYIYTTVWTTADINKWDMEGNLIETFSIPGVSALRDLAYDGTYFYGSDAASYIWEMDFENHTLVSTITTPAAVRAIAYDEEADGFWINNWQTELILVNRSGTQIGTMGIPNDDMYGAAYDPYSAGGPFLWQFNGGAAGCLIQQVDMEGNYTGVTYDPQTALGDTGISGGFWISEGVVAGKASIGGCMQGDTSDKVFAFELCDTAPPDSPGAPTNFVVTPNVSGNLTAVLNWTNPSVTAGGAALTSLTQMRIYRNDTLVNTITNPTIGAAATWTDSSVPSAGIYEYRIAGYNAAGEGLSATARVWVGQDVPAAVSSFTLANAEGDAQLNWANPTTGLHGGAFTMPIQGYHLVRSDGEEFTLTGIMTSYLDTTIPVENNYSYTITPYNSVGDGGSATTDATWIGNSIGVTIGTGTTTANVIPLDFYFCNSLSETIFMADEIGAGGITGGALTHILLYYHFVADIPDRPVNVFVGETDQTSLAGGWISANDLTQVFSGTVDWFTGDNTAVLVLDEPYIYNGGNLVVMFNRPMDEDYYSSSNVFYVSQTTEYPGRTSYMVSDTITYDPYNPPASPSSVDYHPNVTLLFNTEGMGAIEGHVYDSNGSPIAEADVTLNELGITRHTNADGMYTYPAVFEGTYSLTAGKFGYGSVTTTGVTVVADQTNTVNFTLPDLITVTVTGMVAGSDAPTVGLAGATVMLDGYDHFETITGADGTFTIPGVYGNNTYTVTAEYEGYETYIGAAVIGGVDIDLGTVIVNEIAYAPYGAVATLNGTGTAVDLTWTNPDPNASNFFDFESDNGDFVSDNTAGWQWGSDTTYGAHSGTNVWGTVLNGTYPASCNYSLYTPEFTVTSDETVLTFYQKYYTETSFDGGNVKISTDGGGSWTLITPVGGYPQPAISTSNVAIPGEACFAGNATTEWALATFELGAYVGEDIMLRFHFGSDSSVQYNGWYIDDVYIGMPETRGQNSSNGAVRFITSYNVRPITRSLESFSVYRFLYEDLNNPEEWDLIASGVTDTTYSDTDWSDLGYGVYFWGITAMYTNEVESDAAVTNWLGKDTYTTCTVNVTTATGDPTNGAEVSLTGLTPDPDGNTYDYEGVVADGSVTFPSVWRGFYNVSVYLQGFAPWSAENVEITEPTTIEVTVGENLNPVSGLEAVVTADDVFLTWNEPVDAMFFDFEANDGDFVSNNTAGWQWGTDNTYGANSGTNIWGTVLNGTYPASCNYMLDTPEIPVPGNAQLTFYHKYYTETSFDGGNVKISTDGGSTWTLITPVGGYPQPAISTSNVAIPGEACYAGTSTTAWTMATFDLSEYTGETVMFRFHFGSDSSVQYNGWYIDDVRVGAPEVRSLLNYNIYRNTALIDEVDPDQLSYADMNLEDGTYTYDVIAHYTTGDSEPVSATVKVYPVNVTGFVDSSDHPGVGLNGALVVLQNDEYYFETTTVNGNFTLTDVNGSNPEDPMPYNLDISFGSYDSYNTDLEVTDEDIPMGTITLVEQLLPVRNVIAIEQANHSAVDVSWNLPGHGGEPHEMAWHNGTYQDAIGLTSGGTFISAVRFTPTELGDFDGMELNQVDFYVLDVPTSANIVVYTGGSWTGTANAGTQVVSQPVTGLVAESFNSVTLDDPVTINADEEMWIGVEYTHASGGHPSGCDTGPSTDYYGNLLFYSGSWTTLYQAAGYDYNWLITCYAFGRNDARNTLSHRFATPQAPAVLPSKHVGSKLANVFSNSGITMATQPAALSNTVADQALNVTTTRDTRDLQGFKVYRLDEQYETNMNEWVLLTDDLTADDSTYTDTGWGSLTVSAVYEWAVVARYSNGLEAAPRFSNAIPFQMTGDAVFHISCNDGSAPTGAQVVFTNTDGDPEHVYTAIAPASGEVTLEDCWVGMYNVEITLNHFDDYTSSINLPYTGITQDVTLEETLLPVVGLTYEIANNVNVHLWWLDPYTCVGWTEDFEDGAMPEGWTMTTNSAVGWFITQDGSSSYFPIPSHTYYACSNDDAADDDGSVDYLITPAMDFSNISEMSITFDSFYSSAYQAATLEVSTDGGSSWDIVSTLEVNADWTNLTIDLSDYCGAGFNNVMIGFHSDDLGGWSYGWAVDNVVLGDGGEREVQLTRKEVATRTEQTSTRSLLGYRVERYKHEDASTTVLAEQTTDFEWYDMNVHSGTYNYRVYAVYTTGLSELATTEDIIINNSVTPGPDQAVVTALKGNYPNPFNPVTNIAYSVKEDSDVTLEIYNVKGQLVRTLVNEHVTAGNHSVMWNGTDDAGRTVGSGVFFYRMHAGDFTSTQKMILLK